MPKLKGKTAVVIGGSSGIGLATAKLFVEEGAYVFITGRRVTELDKAKATIGRNVTTVQGDLADLDDLDRLFATVKAEKGELDTLVISAGYGGIAPISVVTPEIFDKTFGVNVRGVFFAVQKVIPILRDGGTITFIGSGVHLKGIPHYITYGATKAALRSLTRSLAVELKDRSIRVNTLSPGAIETPMLAGQFSSPEELEAARGMFKQMAPLGRLGRPEEMATAVLFLASSDSSYCTGIDLVSDGGTTQV
jgi:NAD(P)-dependent dehydrogenase (short-subunit alcohol dehydrogenase family)